MSKRHRWREEDDIVALYLFKYGDQSVGVPLDEVAELLGIPAGSLRMRMGNFRAIAGGKGLTNYAQQSRTVYDTYSHTSQADLKKKVEQILNTQVTTTDPKTPMDEQQWMGFINHLWGTLVYWDLIKQYRKHQLPGSFFTLTALACRDKLLMSLAHSVHLCQEIADRFDLGAEAKTTLTEILALYEKGESQDRSAVRFEDCGIKAYRDKILAHPLDHIKELLRKPQYSISLQWTTVEQTLGKIKGFADQVEAHYSSAGHWRVQTGKEEVIGVDSDFAAVVCAMDDAKAFNELQRSLIRRNFKATVRLEMPSGKIVIDD